MRDNPLTWALDSLLGQAGQVLAEIVIADDGSSDHTPAVLDTYRSCPGECRSGPAVARAPGGMGRAKCRSYAARGQWLLFGDDDCVFAPHYTVGAAYVMDWLRDRDPAAAAVMLPFYYRATRPREIAPPQQIGRLAPELANSPPSFTPGRGIPARSSTPRSRRADRADARGADRRHRTMDALRCTPPEGSPTYRYGPPPTPITCTCPRTSPTQAGTCITALTRGWPQST